jgi:hypothetical protein
MPSRDCRLKCSARRRSGCHAPDNLCHFEARDPATGTQRRSWSPMISWRPMAMTPRATRRAQERAGESTIPQDQGDARRHPMSEAITWNGPLSFAGRAGGGPEGIVLEARHTAPLHLGHRHKRTRVSAVISLCLPFAPRYEEWQR